MKKKLVAACLLFAWWFMVYDYGRYYHTTVVGPFGSQGQCEWYRAKVRINTLGCWED